MDRVTLDQVMALGYPQKCRREKWDMAGNLDLVFLEFFRRYPHHDWYWFMEYDVHWEGRWSVFLRAFPGQPVRRGWRPRCSPSTRCRTSWTC